MNSFRTTLMACTAAAALSALAASPAHASVDEYTAEGGQEVRINLELCSAESQLAVRGDTGTDLDFVISNERGGRVYSDQGFDDFLSVVVETKGEGCETYSLAVDNLGEEANTFTVVVEPITDASTRIEKYILDPSQSETVQFKACGTSAKLLARGNGESDVDFVIRNSDEAVVHENDDLTDETTATLEALRSDCETFEMDLVNLGENANTVMVMVTPEGVIDEPFEGTAPSTSLASVSESGGEDAASVRATVEAEGSGAGEYRADAFTSVLVDLPVCGSTRLEVRGDGDTDLDFTVTDDAGETVHSDFDLSDVTFANLEASEECETFKISVDNLGDVYNVFTVALRDPGALGGVSGAGEYRVNANLATKVALRVCEVTRVSASGDGDTDLDFDVTDGDGTTIHSDYDLTDSTSFTLDPGSGCANYAMSVSNLGDVYNMLTISYGEGDPADAARASTVSPIGIDAAPAEVIGSGPGNYSAIENGSVAVELPICDSTHVLIQGDGGTDLDFVVRAQSGNVVHSDYDLDDITYLMVDPGTDCRTYSLQVENLGDTKNAFEVTFSDEAPANLPAGPSAAATGSGLDVPEDTISTDDYNRNLVLLNRTGEAVEVLTWSNSAVLGWGDNQLQDGANLSDGSDWNVNVFDGSAACLFDFLARTQSGREVTVTGVNACEVTTVTFE